MAEILSIDPRQPEPARIARAAGILRKGGVVIYPTRLLYGLGVDALNAEAVSRVFAIKSRTAGKPLLVLIAEHPQVLELALPPGPAGGRLMKHFWPGKVTFILTARQGVAAGLTAGSGKIGLRLAAHPVASALVKALGRPLTGTSANISGAGGCAAVDALNPVLLARVDLVLDCGPLPGGAGSTVVDITLDPPRVLREGAVSAVDILRAYDFFRSESAHKSGNGL